MYLFHIPQCSIQNRNVHISVLNGALWDMEQVDSEICELEQFGHWCMYTSSVRLFPKPILTFWKSTSSPPWNKLQKDLNHQITTISIEDITYKKCRLHNVGHFVRASMFQCGKIMNFSSCCLFIYLAIESYIPVLSSPLHADFFRWNKTICLYFMALLLINIIHVRQVPNYSS